MKIKPIFLMVILFFLQGCEALQNHRTFFIKNQYDRVQLKKMELKNSFIASDDYLIDCNSIYYHYRKNEDINMEFNFILRFFVTGQYAFFSQSENSISNLSYDSIDFNDLEKANYVGYYNVENNVITIEYPNRLFRRSGKRNLDKYEILPNGDLKSITKSASDYGAVYNKIIMADDKFIQTIPDW